MEYEIFQVKDDGSKLEVPGEKISEALAPSSVTILIDHTRRKIYNFNGRESGIRVRFIGARLAAGPIRGELGLSYSIASIDEGEETNEFREFLKSVYSPGSAAVSRILDRPPPPPLPLKPVAPKAIEPAKRPIPEPQKEIVAPVAQPPEKVASSPNKPVTSVDLDISSVVKGFGDTPDGYDIEAIIVKDAVYKNAQIQTKVFGKVVEQNRLEKVTDVDGIFTLDGQARIIAKNGQIVAIQILSKRKPAATKKSQTE
jgi:hypothetical protein